MRAPTVLAILVLALLLHACGDTTSSSEPSSPAQPVSTIASSETTTPPEDEGPPATEPPETSPSTESPQAVGTNGITQEEDLLNPTVAPDTPTMEMTPEGLVIRWSGTGPDVASYLVYRRADPSDVWTIIGEVSPEGDNLGGYSHIIRDESAQIGDYAIVAVDLDGNGSEFALAIRLDL